MEIKVTLEGDKRVAAHLGNHTVVTDQPIKDGGGDSAPAPYDLFMASIATCAGFYIQSYCQNKGIDFTGIEITMSPQRETDQGPISGFITTIHLPATLPERLHPVLKKVATQCAVKKTIINAPTFVVETVTRTD
jgi:ribosomal protein S12 methylthiotransferase accessory factor